MRYLILAACLVCPAVSSAEALKPGTNRVVLKHEPKGKTHPQHLAMERTEATDAGLPSAGADNPGVKPASKKNGSIDVVAARPRFETEPVELNPNAGLEADTRQRDYSLRRLPTNAPPAEMSFVSPGAGGSRHAAKITAREGQGGMLTCTVPVDKGEAMTFSARIRAEGILSVSLTVVASSSRSGGARQPLGPGRFGRGSRGRGAQGPDARSKALRGTFDWTTLSLDTSLVQNIDQASVQVVVHGPGTVWVDDISVKTHWPKRVGVPGKPAAPLYVMALMHSETPQAYIHSRDYFRADATKYEEMAKMLKRYGARLVAQPERELWLGAKKHDPDFIRRLHEEYGVSFSVHTHGPNPRSNPTVQDVLNYVKLRKEEMEALGAGPVTDLNGNFDQKDWDVFAKIGIRTMTAYKNVRTQMGQMAMKHDYRHPWRPAGSPYQGEQQWARHRPESGVVYLPGAGAIHTRHHDRFADLMERHLRAALRHVRADRINVSYFVEHVGRFQPTAPGQSPLKYVSSKAFRDDLAQHEKLYRDVLAPLVKSGHVRYAVPSEVCDRFEDWERKMGIGRQT